MDLSSRRARKSRPIARLRPYARNAKMHGDDQVAKIAASMGQVRLDRALHGADDGELIAGHGRVLAARCSADRGAGDPLSHLDEAERRAYRIADNKLTEWANGTKPCCATRSPGCWPRILRSAAALVAFIALLWAIQVVNWITGYGPGTRRSD